MGREIRRVPKGWKHPKDAKGCFQPMHDETYEDALKDWLNEREKWLANDETRKKAAEKYDCHSFEDWHGEAPDPAYHRPSFDDKATSYQVYETVSEGTPVSPVFADLKSLIAWLIKQGHSEYAARAFAESGWAPSMIMSSSGIRMNIDAFDEMSC